MLTLLFRQGRRPLYVYCTQGISSEKNKTIYSRKMKEMECEELDCHNARFGFALANAKDVDGDGYTGTTKHRK